MANQPQIGIWWDDGARIVAFSHAPGKVDRLTGFCDSDYAHNDLWPEATRRLGLPSSQEYFSVPRGRVLWCARKQVGIIYHGNETNPERLAEIAEQFSLSEWEARIDLHYMMGPDIDELFESGL